MVSDIVNSFFAQNNDFNLARAICDYNFMPLKSIIILRNSISFFLISTFFYERTIRCSLQSVMKKFKCFS